jgi:glycosyltransferase involved in cell wall biosynthesis
LDNPAPEGFSSEQKLGKLSPAKINLIHLNAESYPMAIAYLPDAFTNSYNIGYFYWELSSPAKCHSLGMDLVDEVWVATEYGVEQYAPHMPKQQPVTNVGMAVEDFDIPERDESRAYLESSLGVKPGATVYLAAFDSFSFVQRKNPVAVVKAFLDAFKSDESVHLILKTQNRDFVGDPNQLRIWDEVIRLTGSDDRVTILNKTLKYTDLLKLKRGSDCYVTLHRSEGWGFGMIEAMSLGLPVIATGYSGNLEFCKEDNSWLVNYEESYLSPEDYIFVIPGQKWAKPNHESAVAAIREAYDSPQVRARKASAAQVFVNENFSMDAIAKRFNTRVNEIINSL